MTALGGSPVTVGSVERLPTRTGSGDATRVGNHSTHQALRRGARCREALGRRARPAGDVGQPVEGLDIGNGGREQRIAQERVVYALRVVAVPRAILAAEPRV